MTAATSPGPRRNSFLNLIRDEGAGPAGQRLVKFLLVAVIVLLIALISTGTLSKSKPGAMTWGPTTDFWAIAIAISDLELGVNGGLGRKEVVNILARYLTTTGSDVNVHDAGTRALNGDPEIVDKAIRAAASIDPSTLKDATIDSGLYVTTLFEDIGYADFYELAFRFFGYSAYSAYYLYIAILCASIVIFLLGNWRNNHSIFILSLAMLALFLATTSGIFGPLVPSLAANRFLSTLTLVPLLHLAIAALREGKMPRSQKAILAVQMLLFAFTIHLRSSAVWTALALAALVFLVALLRLPQVRKRLRGSGEEGVVASFLAMPQIRTTLYVALAAIVMVFAYGAVRNSFLNVVYASDFVMPHHMRWHSAMMGLSGSPRWAEDNIWGYGPEISGDTIGFLTYKNYMNHHMPHTKRNWGRFPKIRLDDRILKREFLEFVSKRPLYILELYLYYKPVEIIKVMYGLLKTIPLASWLIAIPIVLLGGAALASAPRPGRFGEFALFLPLAFLVSLLPFLWAYASPYAAADQLIWLVLLICFSAALLLARVLRRFLVAVDCRPGEVTTVG